VVGSPALPSLKIVFHKLPLTPQQVDPLIRELVEYRDLIPSRTKQETAK